MNDTETLKKIKNDLQNIINFIDGNIPPIKQETLQEPASSKQINYLKGLGVDVIPNNLTKKSADDMIKAILNK